MARGGGGGADKRRTPFDIRCQRQVKSGQARSEFLRHPSFSPADLNMPGMESLEESLASSVESELMTGDNKVGEATRENERILGSRFGSIGFGFVRVGSVRFNWFRNAIIFRGRGGGIGLTSLCTVLSLEMRKGGKWELN